MLLDRSKLNVSVVIPTRNRWGVLTEVLPSYLIQNEVSEVIVIDDCSEEAPKRAIANDARVKILRNESRLGSLRARIKGSQYAENEVILFGEDDAFIAPGYVSTLLEELNKGAAITSGQIIYMYPDELIKSADDRFRRWPRTKSLLLPSTLTLKHGHKLEKATEQPFTHALFMTSRKNLSGLPVNSLKKFFLGTGYREETALQIEIKKAAHKSIVVTPKAVCYHLSRRNVPTGGQRSGRLRVLYYLIRNNTYFCIKYGGYFGGRGVFLAARSTAGLILNTYIKPVFVK